MPERPGKLRNVPKESDAVFQGLEDGHDSDDVAPEAEIGMELDSNRRIKYVVEIAAFACAACQEEKKERPGRRKSVVHGEDQELERQSSVESQQEKNSDRTTNETTEVNDENDENDPQSRNGGAHTVDPGAADTEVKSAMNSSSPLRNPSSYNGNFSPFLGRNPPSRAAWFRAFSAAAYEWHRLIPDKDLQTAIKMIRRAKDALRSRYTGWRSSLNLEPPVSVKVVQISAFDLPAMDLAGTSDPYCILKLDTTVFTTEIHSPTLNPVWNKECNFTVTSGSNLLQASIWDWDDGRPDDLIGKGYVAAEDIVRRPQHDLMFPILDTIGKTVGTVLLKLECASLANHEDGSLDCPTCDASEVAALTRIMWVLGVPRSMALQVAKVATLVDVPHDVIKRFGELKTFQTINVCQDHWLIEILKKWKFYTNVQVERREAARDAAVLVKKFQKELDANNWDNRVKALQQKAAAQAALIDIDKHIGYIDGIQTASEENLRLAEDFCRRETIHVTNLGKATRLADHFRSLQPVDGVPLPVSAKETRELIAEILAKFEKEALMIDAVTDAVTKLQERVIAEQGEEGTGLKGSSSAKAGWTRKWLKHKKRVIGQSTQSIPLEVILGPFVSKFKFLKDLRQAAVDTAAHFVVLQDQKGRLELGEVVLSLIEAEQRMIREVEEAAERRNLEFGDSAERIAAEQREYEERQINSCMHWLLMHEERVETDVKEKIEGLVFYFRRNLTQTTSEAVKREREIIVMQVVKVKEKEQRRLEGLGVAVPREEDLPKPPRRRRGAVSYGGGRRGSVTSGRRGSMSGGLFGSGRGEGVPIRRRRSSIGSTASTFSQKKGRKKSIFAANPVESEEKDARSSSSGFGSLSSRTDEGGEVSESEEKTRRSRVVKEISKRLAKEEVKKMKKFKKNRERAKAERDKQLKEKESLFGEGLSLEEEEVLSDSTASSGDQPVRWVPKKVMPKVHYGYYDDEDEVVEEEQESEKPKKKTMRKKAKRIVSVMKLRDKGSTAHPPQADAADPISQPEESKDIPVPPGEEAVRPELHTEQVEAKEEAVEHEETALQSSTPPAPVLEKDDGGTFITGLIDVAIPGSAEPEHNRALQETHEVAPAPDTQESLPAEGVGSDTEEAVPPSVMNAGRRVKGRISNIAGGASVLSRLRHTLRTKTDGEKEKETEALTREQAAVVNSSAAFVEYITMRKRQKAFAGDQAVADRQQKAMLKHRSRQNQIRKAAKSSLAFDYVSFCLGEDALVFQKEYDVQVRMVAMFPWSSLSIARDDDGPRISVCAGERPNAVKLFATDRETWAFWKQTRRRILRKELFVSYYHRVGYAEKDDHPAAAPEGIRVRSAQAPRATREESMGAGLGGVGIQTMMTRRVPIVFGEEKAEVASEEEWEREREAQRQHEVQMERARVFLQGLLRMQALVRRLVVKRKRYFRPKKEVCRQLVLEMVEEAIASSRGGDNLLMSLFGHQLGPDGQFAPGSEAYTFVRSTVPMSQLTYSVGVDWEGLRVEAEKAERAADMERLVGEGRSRVTGAVQDSRQRLLLRCGWLAQKMGIEKGRALSDRTPRVDRDARVDPDDARHLRIPQPPALGQKKAVYRHGRQVGEEEVVHALIDTQAREDADGVGISMAPRAVEHAVRTKPVVKQRQSLQRTRHRIEKTPRWNEDMSTSMGVIRAPRRPRERASDSFANTTHAGPALWASAAGAGAAPSHASMFAMQWWDEGSDSGADGGDEIAYYEDEMSELNSLVIRPTPSLKPHAREPPRRRAAAAGAASEAAPAPNSSHWHVSSSILDADEDIEV